MTCTQQSNVLKCHSVSELIIGRTHTLRFQANNDPKVTEDLRGISVARSSETRHPTEVSCSNGNSCNIYEQGVSG